MRKPIRSRPHAHDTKRIGQNEQKHQTSTWSACTAQQNDKTRQDKTRQDKHRSFGRLRWDRQRLEEETEAQRLAVWLVRNVRKQTCKFVRLTQVAWTCSVTVWICRNMCRWEGPAQTSASFSLSKARSGCKRSKERERHGERHRERETERGV